MVQEENGNGLDWRRVGRGAMVLVMALVPVVALIWAFLNTEPGAVCGSWWYGMLMPLLALGVRGWRK